MSADTDGSKCCYDTNSFVNAVIIGNVNAGKSSLCGRIAYHLGDVSGPTLLEYRKQAQELSRESYYLAWWSDRASIEREKGITIHNHYHCLRFPQNNLTVNITDISGYEYYLKNAIVGCAMNDVAILLIDMNASSYEIKGIQELPNQNYMGSVLQQLLIIKALNIKQIIVVLNKCDLFLNNLVNYKQHVEHIKNTVIGIANKLNLDIKERFYPFIIPISTMNGWNICNNYTKQNAHFLIEHSKICTRMDHKLDGIYDLCSLKTDYSNNISPPKQHTLLNVISNLRLNSGANDSQNGMQALIKRVAINKSHLLLLTCIVIRGTISVRMKIRVHPYDIIVPIYSMQSFKEIIPSAHSGQLICVAIKITDIDTQKLKNVSYNINNINNKFITKYFQRGCLITEYTKTTKKQKCDVDKYGPIEYFEAELDIVYAPHHLKMGYQLSCYSHCTHFRANLMHCFDKTWNDINLMNVNRKDHLKDTNRIYSGETVIVGFNVIDKEIVLMNYDNYPSLGWIVIKDHKSYIVAIGKILYCGNKVTKIEICNAISNIPMIALTKPIIKIIADFAHCGL